MFFLFLKKKKCNSIEINNLISSESLKKKKPLETDIYDVQHHIEAHMYSEPLLTATERRIIFGRSTCLSNL